MKYIRVKIETFKTEIIDNTTKTTTIRKRGTRVNLLSENNDGPTSMEDEGQHLTDALTKSH